MSAITATATRWEHGWELAIDGDVVTQVSTLANARQQLRDYLDTIEPDVDHSTWTIVLAPAQDDLAERTLHAQEATRAAAEAQQRAAREARQVVSDLLEAGYRAADVAAFLDVSRGRVNQLAHV